MSRRKPRQLWWSRNTTISSWMLSKLDSRMQFGSEGRDLLKKTPVFAER